MKKQQFVDRLGIIILLAWLGSIFVGTSIARVVSNDFGIHVIGVV